VPEFGNGTPGGASSATTPSIYDAYVNYRYSPEFQIQAGKVQGAGWAGAIAADVNTSFNERSLVTDLVPEPGSGFELHGDIAGGVLSYAAGIFNGVGDARNSSNIGFQDDRELTGGCSSSHSSNQPQTLAKPRLGVGGSWGIRPFTNTLGLPTRRRLVTGIFHGRQQQFLPIPTAWWQPYALAAFTAASYYYGPSVDRRICDFRSGCPPGSQSADLQNTAWEISGGWVLTGEDARSMA